jgi:hypothetical protein
MDAMSMMSTTPTLFSNDTTLIFENDNPCSTTLTDGQTGRIAYTIYTQISDGKTFTYFQNADGEVLASSEWQPGVDNDFISMGQFSSVPFGSFFRKSIFKE